MIKNYWRSCYIYIFYISIIYSCFLNSKSSIKFSAHNPPISKKWVIRLNDVAAAERDKNNTTVCRDTVAADLYIACMMLISSLITQGVKEIHGQKNITVKKNNSIASTLVKCGYIGRSLMWCILSFDFYERKNTAENTQQKATTRMKVKRTNRFPHPPRVHHLQAPHKHHLYETRLYLSYASCAGFHSQNP